MLACVNTATEFTSLCICRAIFIVVLVAVNGRFGSEIVKLIAYKNDDKPDIYCADPTATKFFFNCHSVVSV